MGMTSSLHKGFKIAINEIEGYPVLIRCILLQYQIYEVNKNLLSSIPDNLLKGQTCMLQYIKTLSISFLYRHSELKTKLGHPQNPLYHDTMMHLWMIHSYISEKLPSARKYIRRKLREIITISDAYDLIRKASNILRRAIEPNVHHIAHHIAPEDATCDDIPQKILEYLCKRDLTDMDPVLKEYLEVNYSKPTQQCLKISEAAIQKKLIQDMISDQVDKKLLKHIRDKLMHLLKIITSKSMNIMKKWRNLQKY